MIHPTQYALSKTWNLSKYWILVLLYCNMIVYFSSQSDPSQNLPSFVFGFSDKLIHGVEYGILGILLYQAFHQTTHTMGSIILGILCATGFGISDEIHQSFVPNRQADIWDIFADIAGATAFVLAWVFVIQRYYARRQSFQDLGMQ